MRLQSAAAGQVQARLFPLSAGQINRSCAQINLLGRQGGQRIRLRGVVPITSTQGTAKGNQQPSARYRSDAVGAQGQAALSSKLNAAQGSTQHPILDNILSLQCQEAARRKRRRWQAIGIRCAGHRQAVRPSVDSELGRRARIDLRAAEAQIRIADQAAFRLLLGRQNAMQTKITLAAQIDLGRTTDLNLPQHIKTGTERSSASLARARLHRQNAASLRQRGAGCEARVAKHDGWPAQIDQSARCQLQQGGIQTQATTRLQTLGTDKLNPVEAGQAQISQAVGGTE